MSPVMEEIALHPARFKVVVAGRRFGKTYLSLMWLLMGKLKPDERRWIILPTYRQGKMVAFPVLKKLIQSSPLAHINESELRFTINNCEVAVKGSEDSSKLRGSHLDRVVLDEYAYMKPNVWEEVVYPMMTTNPKSSALFIGTPDGFSNGFYDLYLKGQGGDKDWKSWQFTTIDGGWVSEEELERAKRTMDERIYKQEFEASFETAQNRCAYNFDRKTHIIDSHEKSPTAYIGMDFNVSKMTAVCVYEYSDGTIHYFDEVILRNSNTEEMAKVLRNKYPDIDTVYPDPAGQARSTTSNRSDHAILKENGYFVRARIKHPSHRDRLNALNRKLLDADGNIKMTISPKCKELIKDLEQCVRDVKTGGIQKMDIERTHALDACSYLIEYRWPVKWLRATSINW
tara:strand:- start:1756 stop:2955 length:1200 start_codon:yes stop_codon:yes gene_type:complete